MPAAQFGDTARKKPSKDLGHAVFAHLFDAKLLHLRRVQIRLEEMPILIAVRAIKAAWTAICFCSPSFRISLQGHATTLTHLRHGDQYDTFPSLGKG